MTTETRKEYLNRKSREYAKTEKRKKYLAKKQRVYNAKNKLICLRHYGGDIPRCKKCGICDIRFLVLDHIDNNGGYERKKTKTGGGVYFYRWLIKNDFPSHLQVLCFHCNLTKPRTKQ